MVNIESYIELGHKYKETYSKKYGLDKNKDFKKEKAILETSLDNSYFRIKELFKKVYFSNVYNSFLFATGRGTGKTTQAIKIALWHIVYKKTDVLCFKEFENSTTELQQAFTDIIHLLGIEVLFEIKRTEIRCKLNSNRIIFKGVRSVKSSFESSISIKNKLKVFTNIGLLLLDECNTITYDILDTLITTMRNHFKEQVKIIGLFNPYTKESPIESYFKGRKSCLVCKNEFSIKDLTEEYRDVSLWNEYKEDKLSVSKGILNEKVFNQRWYGIPNEIENGLVYSNLELYEDIGSLSEYKTIFAIDPAFGGKDTCAMSIVTEIRSNIFVFTGFSWQESIESCIEEIEFILERMNIKEGFIEGNNLSQEWLSNHLKRSSGFNVTVDKPRLNKNYRITQSLYAYMSYYTLELEYSLGNYKKILNSRLFFSNLFNYVLNSNKNDNEADALTYGIYYHKGLEI